MKKRTITLISVLGVIILTLVILFTTGTIPQNDLAGTIVKTSKYRQQQTTVGDIILSPDVLKDTTQGKQLALNLSQLSFITESIADQTNEIINRIDNTSMATEDKNAITLPLSKYRDMIVTNMTLMRNSSEKIITAINNNTTEMTDDIDKSFQDIGGFFNRYKTDNNAFTNAIIDMEKLVVKNSDGTQEGPSDFEIIRDNLYTVAYLNANFLQEKELKKELLKKIIAETDKVDDNPNTLIYNNQLKAFQAVSMNTELSGINGISGYVLLCSGENSGLNAEFFLHSNNTNINSINNAIELTAESMDISAINSMTVQSMEKYSGSYTMNVNDLKSIFSQDELMMIASSPIMSLTKASVAKLASVMSNEELKSLNIYSSNSEALKVALGLLVVNAVNDLNLQIEASSLAVFLANNKDINSLINNCLSADKLQFFGANSLDAVSLTGTFDTNLGVSSQVGLDFLPKSLGITMWLNNMEGLKMFNNNIMINSSSLSLI